MIKSASTITRLKAALAEEFERWNRRVPSAKRHAYLWADGIYFRPRLDHEKQCLLVIIGADEVGNKDIVGLSDGYRESAQNWLELLLDLERRGLTMAPELATGDGALGFSTTYGDQEGSAYNGHFGCCSYHPVLTLSGPAHRVSNQ